MVLLGGCLVRSDGRFERDFGEYACFFLVDDRTALARTVGRRITAPFGPFSTFLAARSSLLLLPLAGRIGGDGRAAARRHRRLAATTAAAGPTRLRLAPNFRLLW